MALATNDQLLAAMVDMIHREYVAPRFVDMFRRPKGPAQFEAEVAKLKSPSAAGRKMIVHQRLEAVGLYPDGSPRPTIRFPKREMIVETRNPETGMPLDTEGPVYRTYIAAHIGCQVNVAPEDAELFRIGDALTVEAAWKSGLDATAGWRVTEVEHRTKDRAIVIVVSLLRPK